MFKFFILITIFFFLISCNSNNDNINKTDISENYLQTDSCIYYFKYDSIGNMVLKRQLDFDSIVYGVEEEFINGNLSKWKWFEKGQKFPYMIVYLDNNGNYVGYKGTPFIREFYTEEGYVASKMVNVPFLSVLVGYKEFKNGAKTQFIPYIPEIAINYAWVRLDEHKYDSTTQYHLCYYILNKNKDSIFDFGFTYLQDTNNILDSIDIQLHHPDTIPPILRNMKM